MTSHAIDPTVPAAPRDGRQARGDRTRAALVEAAVTLFARQGVEATAVDEITAAAEVAKGTFYVHFQRKEDVLLEHAAQLLVSLEHESFEGPVDVALHALAERLTLLLADLPRPLVGRIVREVVGHRDAWLHVLGTRKTLGQVIAPIVERGQATGELRSDQSSARLAQALTILWLDNVIGWAERPEGRPLTRDLGLATALFLEGARVSQP